MYTKDNMIPALLVVSPSFTPIWNKFINDWKDDAEGLPLYLIFGDLACYIENKITLQNHKELERIFSIVEQWHIKGDSYVKEAATVGLLETLQNTNVVKKESPKIIEKYLLPKSLEQWKKVYEFWEKGVLISQ